MERILIYILILLFWLYFSLAKSQTNIFTGLMELKHSSQRSSVLIACMFAKLSLQNKTKKQRCKSPDPRRCIWFGSAPNIWCWQLGGRGTFGNQKWCHSCSVTGPERKGTNNRVHFPAGGEREESYGESTHRRNLNCHLSNLAQPKVLPPSCEIRPLNPRVTYSHVLQSANYSSCQLEKLNWWGLGCVWGFQGSCPTPVKLFTSSWSPSSVVCIFKVFKRDGAVSASF